MTLELDLPPDNAARLWRLPAIMRGRTGRTATRPVRLVWHDTAAGVLAEAPSPDLPPVPARGAPLSPVAAFEGRERTLDITHAEGPVSLLLLEGRLRSVTSERPCARLRLTGTPAAVASLALAAAEGASMSIPRASLAAEALAFAHGTPVPPRHLGAPDLPADLPDGLPDGLTVETAAITVIGQLTDVLLHWAPLAARPMDADASEPVHQLRVATRRLRSALSIFDRAIGCQAVADLRARLKPLDALLGPARDWDVFLRETGETLREALPDDRSLAKLLAAATRQRHRHHQALRAHLDSAAFRGLGIALATLGPTRPWRLEADESRLASLESGLAPYARATLKHRLKKLPLEDDISALPPEPLHHLRLRAKRLRHAAECFAPLFPGKPARRFLKRLATLQDRLGAFNDTAVAMRLLEELDGRGAGQAHAKGLVRGFLAARDTRSRHRVATAWNRLRDAKPFWE